MPTVIFSRNSGVTRDEILVNFRNQNIDARVFFWPISSMPPFSDDKGTFHAHDIPTRAINLPSYHDITDVDMNRVIDVISNTIKNKSTLSGKKE